MALKGKKAQVVEKRLKVLFYGKAGVGKTMAALGFPDVYFIDCEKGAEQDEYVAALERSNGLIFKTADFDELYTEIKSLLTEKHDFKTLVIDPITTIYHNLVEAHASKGADATSYGKHYVEAKKDMRKLIQLLLRLDMNVIITSHSKKEYNENMTVLGTTFDAYDKLDYLFDLVIEIKKQGLKRFGIPRKSRIKNFPEGEEFEFSYKTIAEKYGKDILEKKATAEVLATAEQVKELKRLIALLKVPEDVTDKWLSAANSSSFNEMSSEKIAKCIESLQQKVNGKE